MLWNSLGHQDSLFKFSNFSSAEEFFSNDFWREFPVLMFSEYVFLDFQREAKSLPLCSSIIKYWVSVTWVAFPLPCYHKHRFLLFWVKMGIINFRGISMYYRNFLKYFSLNLILKDASEVYFQFPSFFSSHAVLMR